MPSRAPILRAQLFGVAWELRGHAAGGGGHPEPEEAAVPGLGHSGRLQWDARSRGGSERVHAWDRPGLPGWRVRAGGVALESLQGQRDLI